MFQSDLILKKQTVKVRCSVVKYKRKSKIGRSALLED